MVKNYILQNYEFDLSISFLGAYDQVQVLKWRFCSEIMTLVSEAMNQRSNRGNEELVKVTSGLEPLEDGTANDHERVLKLM